MIPCRRDFDTQPGQSTGTPAHWPMSDRGSSHRRALLGQAEGGLSLVEIGEKGMSKMYGEDLDKDGSMAMHVVDTKSPPSVK